MLSYLAVSRSVIPNLQRVRDEAAKFGAPKKEKGNILLFRLRLVPAMRQQAEFDQ